MCKVIVLHVHVFKVIVLHVHVFKVTVLNMSTSLRCVLYVRIFEVIDLHVHIFRRCELAYASKRATDLSDTTLSRGQSPGLIT